MQLKVQPELHYGDPECPIKAPENFPVSAELLYEVELFNFCKAKVIIAPCIDRILNISSLGYIEQSVVLHLFFAPVFSDVSNV